MRKTGAARIAHIEHRYRVGEFWCFSVAAVLYGMNPFLAVPDWVHWTIEGVMTFLVGISIKRLLWPTITFRPWAERQRSARDVRQ